MTRSRHFQMLTGIAVLLLSGAVPLSKAIAQTSIPEEIEWTWEVRPPHPSPTLPNVLLLGDSITRNYFPQVTKDLKDFANVYLMAVSTSVGDSRLPKQIAEFANLEHVTFRVVHFNNGMHGWGYSETQYEAAFPSLLRSVKRLVPDRDSLIWATITPVQANAFNGATNERIEERNRIALSKVRAAGIKVDDQHTLMQKHLDTYEDTVHFGTAGAALMGDQAAEIIRAALKHQNYRRHRLP